MGKLRDIEILREHELLTLLGVVELLRRVDQSFTIINHIFEEYKEKCRHYCITPHNKSSFRRHLGQLMQMNFITSKLMKNGRCLEITLSGRNLDKLLGHIIKKRFVSLS